MAYANLPGVDLWYEYPGGDGIPVIFCHAASGTCEAWAPQLPAFTAAGYRCIAYDRRTWGKSRNTDDDLQPGHQDQDLHGLVEHLALDRFHLVGTAAGGITAIGYALAHPERVRSLVAANTISGIQDPEYLEVQHRLRPPEIQALPVELRELGPSYRGADPQGAARWLEIELASRPYSPVPSQPLVEPVTYAGLSGVDAPRLWTDGNREAVVTYCKQDASLTLQVARSTQQTLRLDWTSRFGRPNNLLIPEGWLTVRQAADLPLPDTSWMDAPIPRSAFDSWLYENPSDAE